MYSSLKLLLLVVNTVVLLTSFYVTAHARTGEETLCWLRKKGVCFNSSSPTWTCPIPESRTWWRGCPQGFTCCVPPARAIQRRLTPGGCGFRAVVRHRIMKRVVGGWRAYEGSLPWQAFLKHAGGRRACGGTVISRRWILTAAHCFMFWNSQRKNAPKLWVDTGVTDLRRHDATKVQSIKVSKIIVHEKFNDPFLSHDIALVKLSKNLTLNNATNTICLPRENETFENTICTVSGWGLFDKTYAKSRYLRALHIPVIKWQQCKTMHTKIHRDNFIYRHNLCTLFPSGGRDFCWGDSGGPLSCRMGSGQWILAGVSSWGDMRGCGLPNTPGVYTKVAAFLNWISRHTGINLQ